MVSMALEILGRTFVRERGYSLGVQPALLQFSMRNGGKACVVQRMAGTAGARALSLIRPASPEQISKMRCTNLVWDRYQPAIHEDQPNLTFGSRGWLTQFKLRRGSNFRSLISVSAIKKSDPDFTPQGLGTMGTAVFMEFNNSLAMGQTSNLYEVATETLSDCLLNEQIPRQQLAGTSRLAQIINVQDVDIVQSRLVRLNNEARDFVFAQVTIKFTSEARLVSPALAARKGTHPKGYIRRTATQKTGSGIPKPQNVNTGYFLVGLDNSKGEYYYHNESHAAVYKCPPNFFISSVYADKNKGTLGVMGKTLSENPVDGTVKQQHIVTFERPLFKDIPWRIAFF